MHVKLNLSENACDTKPLKMHVKLNLSENACETTVFSGLLVAPENTRETKPL